MSVSFDMIVGLLVRLAVTSAAVTLIVLLIFGYYSFKLVSLFKKRYYRKWVELTANKAFGPAFSLPYFSIVPYVYSKKFEDDAELERLKFANKRLFIALIAVFSLPFLSLFVIFLMAVLQVPD